MLFLGVAAQSFGFKGNFSTPASPYNDLHKLAAESEVEFFAGDNTPFDFVTKSRAAM